MISTLVSLCFLATTASASASGPVIEAAGELSASTLDAHGDTVGGIGSAIVYDARNDVYFMLSDRGPGDGTLPYRPRFAVLRIDQEGQTLKPRLLETVIFKDTAGRAMTGLIPDDPDAELPMMRDGRTCIDPEAMALSPQGTLYVTDEYGPFLYEFQRDGVMIRRIKLPEEFEPREASGKLNYTDKARLVSGRAINQGPEGMCLLPGGTRAALIFQSASVQDGGKPSGRTKIVVIELPSGRPVASYWYEMSPDAAGVKSKKLSVNDLVCLDESRLLVLERDGAGRDGDKAPKLAAYKSVWLADLSVATNLLTAEKDSSPVPVKKSLLFNLATLVPDQKNLSAKWEGLAVIPPSDDRTLTIMMSADNDFLAPTIHEEGKTYDFPRAEDAVPTQFFKIRTPLPGQS